MASLVAREMPVHYQEKKHGGYRIYQDPEIEIALDTYAPNLSITATTPNGYISVFSLACHGWGAARWAASTTAPIDSVPRGCRPSLFHPGKWLIHLEDLGRRSQTIRDNNISPTEAWQKSIQEIGSAEFSASLNTTCGTRTFMKALARQPALSTTLQALWKSRPLETQTLEKIRTLTNCPNPNDTALAALLLAINTAQPRLGLQAAECIARKPGCRHAGELAQRIIQKGLSH